MRTFQVNIWGYDIFPSAKGALLSPLSVCLSAGLRRKMTKQIPTKLGRRVGHGPKITHQILAQSQTNRQIQGSGIFQGLISINVFNLLQLKGI